MQLVPSLFWRDLMEISLEPKVPPLVRRSAERHLVNRLPGLTAGEKMTIARRAGHGVLQQLRQDPEPRVVEALMENPRTTEGVLLPLVRSEAAAPEILQAVARNARWGVRYPIRVALCRNPRTPQQLALRTLTALKKPDLKAVSADARLAQPVRKRARQLLGEDLGRRTGI